VNINSWLLQEKKNKNYFFVEEYSNNNYEEEEKKLNDQNIQFPKDQKTPNLINNEVFENANNVRRLNYDFNDRRGDNHIVSVQPATAQCNAVLDNVELFHRSVSSDEGSDYERKDVHRR
jgi:hypothetical protein